MSGNCPEVFCRSGSLSRGQRILKEFVQLHMLPFPFRRTLSAALESENHAICWHLTIQIWFYNCINPHKSCTFCARTSHLKSPTKDGEFVWEENVLMPVPISCRHVGRWIIINVWRLVKHVAAMRVPCSPVYKPRLCLLLSTRIFVPRAGETWIISAVRRLQMRTCART